MPGSETVYLGSPSSFGAILLASSTVTQSVSGAKIPGIEKYTSALFQLEVGTVSGTSPTLNVYIQTLLPDNTTWQDIVSFTQVTSSTSHQIAHFPTGASSIAAVQTEALSAGSIKAIGLGCFLRVRCVVTGSSPSFGSTVVYANFFE